MTWSLATDTIAACATPWGHSALAMVRVSGPDARSRAEAVVGRLPAPRLALWRRFRDATGAFDDGMVTWFPGPDSYTGEDVVELTGHGNPLLVERLLRALGARPARPGEFTRRAFLHGRLDLTRAEAVLAALEATSARGLEHARAGLDGAVAFEVGALRDVLTDVAAELEAGLDYPGEDLLFAPEAALRTHLIGVGVRSRAMAGTFTAGRIAVQGARVVLAGPVNAGKSSLFNALLGRERAIVSPTPGTTRDAVEATLQLPEVRITLVDTAGERETPDVLEAIGMQRAAEEAAAADLVIRCIPPGEAPPAERPNELRVGTMIDRSPSPVPLGVSAQTGEGLDLLREALVRALVGETPGSVVSVLTSARQAELFSRVADRVDEAAVALESAGPAVAVELLYSALEALAEVSGASVREAVLDRVFARFCIGK